MSDNQQHDQTTASLFCETCKKYTDHTHQDVIATCTLCDTSMVWIITTILPGFFTEDGQS